MENTETWMWIWLVLIFSLVIFGLSAFISINVKKLPEKYVNIPYYNNIILISSVSLISLCAGIMIGKGSIITEKDNIEHINAIPQILTAFLSLLITVLFTLITVDPEYKVMNMNPEETGVRTFILIGLIIGLLSLFSSFVFIIKPWWDKHKEETLEFDIFKKGKETSKKIEKINEQQEMQNIIAHEKRLKAELLKIQGKKIAKEGKLNPEQLKALGYKLVYDKNDNISNKNQKGKANEQLLIENQKE